MGDGMYGTVSCPRCGRQMFADMDKCYECGFEREADDDCVVPTQAYGTCDEEVAIPTLGLRVQTSSVDVCVPLPAVGLVIGRGSGCDVVLHDPAVSRRHVSVRPAEGGAVACDLGARNRAMVGDEEVGEATPLGQGDVLAVCGSRFTLQVPRS